MGCEDLNGGLSGIMKMWGVGVKYYDRGCVEGFMEEGGEFDKKYGGRRDKMMKRLRIFDEDDGWRIVGGCEVMKWYECGEYEGMVNGRKGKICGVWGEGLGVSGSWCGVCGNSKF